MKIAFCFNYIPALPFIQFKLKEQKIFALPMKSLIPGN